MWFSDSAFKFATCIVWRDKRCIPRTMIVLKVVLKGKLMTFRELLVYLAFSLVPGLFFTVHHVFILFAALHDGQSQGSTFKFVARQIVASVVIWAAKLEFVAESRTRVYFAQHVASTCNTVFCCETSWSQRGNSRNRGFQLAMQQCFKTSWR